MTDTQQAHDDGGTIVSDRRSWRRRGTGAKVAVGIIAAVVLAGFGWWTYARPTPAADSAAVTVLEPDLGDPGRLQSVLASDRVPARIQIVHVKEVDGVTLIGCDGKDQDGLPQIDDVVGPPPVIHKIGNSLGLQIKTSAMPRGTQLSFVYWVMPGNTKRSAIPTMSLHNGTPPTCVPPTAAPQGVVPRR